MPYYVQGGLNHYAQRIGYRSHRPLNARSYRPTAVNTKQSKSNTYAATDVFGPQISGLTYMSCSLSLSLYVASSVSLLSGHPATRLCSSCASMDYCSDLTQIIHVLKNLKYTWSAPVPWKPWKALQTLFNRVCSIPGTGRPLGLLSPVSTRPNIGIYGERLYLTDRSKDRV